MHSFYVWSTASFWQVSLVSPSHCTVARGRQRIIAVLLAWRAIFYGEYFQMNHFVWYWECNHRQVSGRPTLSLLCGNFRYYPVIRQHERIMNDLWTINIHWDDVFIGNWYDSSILTRKCTHIYVMQRNANANQVVHIGPNPIQMMME